ncbi:hypothetical protein AB4Z14_21575 [Terrabacter sp. 2TAF16]|uniref:hypothetical protein n=1 Tax=Terrabacter sp. 2TAF16 TaxID=3233008 RepID=UPI003F963CEC
MTTLSTLDADLAPRDTVRRFLRSRFVRFLTAYVEMTIAMVVGMGLFGALWDAVWPGLTSRPAAMALTMAFDMTFGMAAWMWVRGHGRRHIAEMSAVMVLPFVVLLVPYWLDFLSGGDLMTWGHVGMYALMAAYLAWRPHTHDADAPHPADTPADALHTASRSGPRPALVSAVLLVSGAALAVVGGVLHPHEEPPNSHAAVFAEYARSTDWVWVHYLQFASAAVVVAGFLAMGQALSRAGVAPLLVRLGDAAAAATAALIAANMAVDGVALKRAVDAWATAGPADRASRFAAAETVRWLEWGVNSFFLLLLGVTVLVFATALLRQAHRGTRVRLAGMSGAFAGGLLVVNGLAVGAHGFEPSTLPLVATGLYVVMALGIRPLDRLVPQRDPVARAVDL